MRWMAGVAAGVLCLALQSLPCKAAEWKRLYSTADRSVDIDLADIHRSGEVVLAWVKFSYVKEQSDPARRPYRSMLQLWAYQCGLGRHALMQFAEYARASGEGNVVASDARDRYQWSYPEPDTIGEAAMKLACSRASKMSPNAATAL